MNKQAKKLTLNKETLRDLTPKDTGKVRGACPTPSIFTYTGCPTLYSCKPQCNGHTWNKKCGF